MAYCECGCGIEVKNRFVRGHNIKLKPPMFFRNNIDCSGQKYGKWTVIKKLHKKHGRQYYLLRCECGNEKTQYTSNFKRNMMCRKCSNRLNPKCIKEYGLSSRIQKINGYKKSAKRRNLEWNLTDEETIKLMEGECYYCGRKPYKIFSGNPASNGTFLCNGIDRVDNNLGYTPDNCVSCCMECNWAKNSMSKDQFLNLIKLIYNHCMEEIKKWPMVSDIPIVDFLRMDQEKLFPLVQ